VDALPSVPRTRLNGERLLLLPVTAIRHSSCRHGRVRHRAAWGQHRCGASRRRQKELAATVAVGLSREGWRSTSPTTARRLCDGSPHGLRRDRARPDLPKVTVTTSAGRSSPRLTSPLLMLTASATIESASTASASGPTTTSRSPSRSPSCRTHPALARRNQPGLPRPWSAANPSRHRARIASRAAGGSSSAQRSSPFSSFCRAERCHRLDPGSPPPRRIHRLLQRGREGHDQPAAPQSATRRIGALPHAGYRI